MKTNNFKLILKVIFAFYLIIGIAGVALFLKNGNANEGTAVASMADANLKANEEDEESEQIIIERTDDASAELENVASKIEAVSDSSDAESSDGDAIDTEDVDDDGVGYVEVETSEEPPENVEIHTEISGDYVGEVEVNVQGGNGLNMRTGPGKEYRVIDDYKNGSILYIVDGDGTESWIHVTDGQREGYMSTKHLTVILY